MNKKLISFFIIFSILFSSLIFQFVYAIENNEQSNKNENQKPKILTATSLEVSPNSQFSLNIDISKITFENFNIELSSNSELSTPIIDYNNQNLSAEIIGNNILEITASKSNLENINSLTLNYIVPENIDLESTIKFNIVISDISEKSSNAPLKDDISIKIIKSDNNEPTDSDNSNNDKQDILDEPNSNNQNSKPSINNQNNNNQNQYLQTNNSNLATNHNNSNLEVSTSTNRISTNTKSSLSTTTESITYNGSSNNYLASLSIDSYEFTKDFVKTNSSYFITVPNDVTSVNINATCEESTAKVCIYGNSDLSVGTNKILISVTAENGNVRIYRIYVTRN